MLLNTKALYEEMVNHYTKSLEWDKENVKWLKKNCKDYPSTIKIGVRLYNYDYYRLRKYKKLLEKEV